MTWEDYDNISWLLDFGMPPAAGMGRADLPVGMVTWIRPVQLARAEAAREASSG